MADAMVLEVIVVVLEAVAVTEVDMGGVAVLVAVGMEEVEVLEEAEAEETMVDFVLKITSFVPASLSIKSYLSRSLCNCFL